jgi:hypothetical protein
MSEAMPITTIREVFPDEWVTAHVTDVDASDVPMAGVVLFHSPNEETVFQVLKAYRDKHPKARLYTFFTGDVIAEGVHIAFPLG